MFHTEICDLLGIKYPIIQGAMGGISDPGLAAAVSNAGALGVLAAWGRTKDQLRQDINETRKFTDMPFAVNIMPISPAFTESRAKIVIEEGVKIVTTGRSDPRAPIVNMLKDHGIKVMPVVPTVRHAIRVEEEGVDAIIASGTEAGGHVGSVATMPLLPQVVNVVKVPVIAAGGIGDASGFVAALALGACGVQMGTRFIASHESAATEIQKKIVTEYSDEDTVVTPLFTGKPVRFLQTPVVKEFVRQAGKGKSRNEIKSIVSETIDFDMKNPEEFIMTAGQITGLISAVESVDDIIKNIIYDAEKICTRLNVIKDKDN